MRIRRCRYQTLLCLSRCSHALVTIDDFREKRERECVCMGERVNVFGEE